jgi:hypothetical protein
MKKSILIISVALSICFLHVNAQQSMFKKGDVVVNATVGFGSVLFSGLGYVIGVPPLAVSAEYGILDKVIDKGSVGVGGYLGFSSYKYAPNDIGYRYNNIIIGARGVLHYPFVPKLDTYTGLMVGFNIESVNNIGTPFYPNPALGSRPAWSWFIGGRYYFNNQFAALAELGYGIAWFNIGIAYKIM